MNGGKQWWAINSVAVNRDSLFNSSGSAVAIGRSFNMENNFFKYVLGYKKTWSKTFIAPVVLASRSDRGRNTYYPWPYSHWQNPPKKSIW